jgi:hypothetical protein
VAIAQVGGVAVHWTMYTDRVVQDVILPTRPPAARLDEQLIGIFVVITRDNAGGYVVSDGRSIGRFIIRAPTVVDAAGQSRPATLTWTPTAARIEIDPVFLASATYPVTVSMTVEFGAAQC